MPTSDLIHCRVRLPGYSAGRQYLANKRKGKLKWACMFVHYVPLITCSSSMPPRPNWPCDALPQQYNSILTIPLPHLTLVAFVVLLLRMANRFNRLRDFRFLLCVRCFQVRYRATEYSRKLQGSGNILCDRPILSILLALLLLHTHTHAFVETKSGTLIIGPRGPRAVD